MNRIPSFSRVAVLMTVVAVVVMSGSEAAAQGTNELRYDMGTPTVDTVWVDPVAGDDGRDGGTRATALATVREAWDRIPTAETLIRGRRIMLTTGVYNEENVPNYWESRHGTFEHPVILQAADGPGSVVLPAMNVYDCRYLYLLGILTTSGGGDVLHFEACDHILLRDVSVVGVGNIADFEGPQEALKINQSRHVYVEYCDISGATDNAVDFVGVQHGHIVRSKIHRAMDWAMYLKGGSAYFTVEGNELYGAGTGGFTAGQGTGFQFMTLPWIHYEAYDLKVVNNLIHDVEGAGLGVQGGYNILMAHNTIYRAGIRSHMFEAVFGGRSCDGRPGDDGRERCDQYIEAGGWGTTVVDDGTNFVRIPNRNVYIYNNLFYNPDGVQSADMHMTIFGPHENPVGSNAPNPARADDNLKIRGNLFWNGPVDHPLGIGDGQGCPDGNPNCNRAQLLADNAFNTIRPRLVDPTAGDFRPVQDDPLSTATTYEAPDFPGGDRPLRPESPQGDPVNRVRFDRDGLARTGTGIPGAYLRATGAVLAPGRPAPIAPLNGLADLGVATELRWKPADRSDRYEVQVSEERGFLSLAASEANRTATSYIPSGLAPGRTYYWRVRGLNDAGASEWSEPWSFSTEQSTNVEAEDNMNEAWLVVESLPSHSEAMVTFFTPRTGAVSLVLTAPDGRIARTVAAHEFDAGRHRLTFAVDDLPSGLYFLRLATAQSVIIARTPVVH